MFSMSFVCELKLKIKKTRKGFENENFQNFCSVVILVSN